MKKCCTITIVLFFSFFKMMGAGVNSDIEKSNPKDVLFSSDFSSAAEFNEKWTADTWTYFEYTTGFDGLPGVALCSTYGGDNYDLVTKSPVTLSDGGYNVSFQLRSRMANRPESIRLLYGTSSNPSEMTEIYENEGFTTQFGVWASIVCNFNIEVSGDYYFAFQAFSASGSEGIFLDDVTIESGSLGTAPDLAVSNVILPASVCGLTDSENVSCTVTNVGTADVENFSLYLFINDGLANMIPISELIPAGQSKVILLEDIADFSIEDTYTVKVVSICESDLNEENDFATAEVTHYSPITELPKEYTFTSQTPDANEWIPESINGWGLGSGGWTSRLPNIPLMSRCFVFSEGTYQIEITYSAGDELEGASFKILAGATGTDIFEWETIREFTDEIAQGVTRTASFTIEEEGTYSFAILVTANMISVTKFVVNTGVANDISIESWDVKPKFTKIPVEHLTAGYNFSAKITNTGTVNATDVKVSILGKDDDVLNESETSTLISHESKTFEVTSPISGFEIGETATVKVLASMTETDGKPSDNLRVYNFSVTDSILSLDNGVKRGAAEVGIKGGYGTLIHFTATDTITSINIDWAENTYGAGNFSLSLHKVQYPNGLLMERLFTVNNERPEGSIEVNYPVPNHILEPGYYYIEIAQPNGISLNVGVDLDSNGYFYGTSAQQSDGYYLTEPQTGIGSLLIRPCFGHGKTTKDVEIVSIDTPNISTRLFSANEKVSATIKNNGKLISGFKVYCAVNDGEPVEKHITDEFLSDRTLSVEFDVDLSASGKNIVKIYVVEEDDINPDNDVITRTFYNMEPGAYVMDFESCGDFAIANFNPNWTTFDGDNDPTVEFDNTFPNMQEKLGFIVFNPSSTTPALTNEYIQPFEGERFGASLRTESGLRNDWLISPKLLLGDNSKLIFQAKTFYAPGLPVNLSEIFNVLISTTDNAPENFTLLSGSNIAPTNWNKYEFDLSDYDNQSVHVAIQCVTEEGLIFMIDNIEIFPPRTNGTGIKNIDTKINVYPNPVSDVLFVNVGDIRINEIIISNIAGNIVHQNNPKNHSAEYSINVGNLSSGVYIITLKSDNRISTSKFIVK